MQFLAQISRRGDAVLPFRILQRLGWRDGLESAAVVSREWRCDGYDQMREEVALTPGMLDAAFAASTF
jgi:hypothetical protein